MPSDDQAAAAVPSLVESLQAYIDDLPQDQQADALHHPVRYRGESPG